MTSWSQLSPVTMQILRIKLRLARRAILLALKLWIILKIPNLRGKMLKTVKQTGYSLFSFQMHTPFPVNSLRIRSRNQGMPFPFYVLV